MSDRGRGVPPDKLPHLFRKHADLAGRDRAGLGLGLAICKGLVEAHGGRIWAESGGAGHGGVPDCRRVERLAWPREPRSGTNRNAWAGIRRGPARRGGGAGPSVLRVRKREVVEPVAVTAPGPASASAR